MSDYDWTIYSDPRFWDKVKFTEGGCWNWTGTRSLLGYGKFYLGRGRIGGSTGYVGAHRIAWLLSGRVLARRKSLHHVCGNRACVNPAHLRALSVSDHRKLHSFERKL